MDSARDEAEQISRTTVAIHERLQRGGKLIIFGNGGSATDANDFAIDCVPAYRAGTSPSLRFSHWGDFVLGCGTPQIRLADVKGIRRAQALVILAVFWVCRRSRR